MVKGSFSELQTAEDGFDAILRPYVDGISVDAKALAKYVEATSIKAGEHLFRQGDAADRVYFVRAGTVDLRLDQRRIARARGAVLGELCFLLKRRQSLDATAHTHCALWCWSRIGGHLVR